jgi:DNA (cytosine-5)-methyltransferase 1
MRGADMYLHKNDGFELNVYDLFSGCGGLSLALKEACNLLGLKAKYRLCLDLDKNALGVYKRNFNPDVVICDDITNIVKYQLWSQNRQMSFAVKPTVSKHFNLFKKTPKIVIGGPPCQGHSGFNNHTRADDIRNLLYYTVPAVAVSLEADFVIIENVPLVVKDKHGVVDHSIEILQSAGYHVDTMISKAELHGVPQLRRRHFLVASRYKKPSCSQVQADLTIKSPTVIEAIEDLIDIEVKSTFDKSATLSKENIERVNYLFDHNLFKLPNQIRPDCHKDGHSYPSVYGRIKPDEFTNTITTGFMSPGRGRYIHPTRRRALTPHEAARIQGFPDSFIFSDEFGNELSSSSYGKVIGDAVPPFLGMVPICAALLTHPLFQNKND